MKRKRSATGDEWVRFRTKHLFPQAKLAEHLGIARRTVQYIEAKRDRSDREYRPTARTLSQFRALKAKFETGAE